MATSFEPHVLAEAKPAAQGWIAAQEPSRGFVERSLVVEEPAETLDPIGDEHEAQSDAAFEAGRQAGLAEAQAEFEIERAARSKLASRIEALDEAASKALQARIADLVSGMCEAVLGRQAVDPALFQVRCEDAVKALNMPLDRITLHLHPQDSAMLDPGFRAMWTVAEDRDCGRGTIRLEGDGKIIRDGPQDWQRAIAEAIRT